MTSKCDARCLVVPFSTFQLMTLLTLACMLCLISMNASAQPPAPPPPPLSTQSQASEPIFSYDTPSDEMDFDLPATPDLQSVAPPPPPEDPLSQVDRFFSDAPVMELPEEPKAEKVEMTPFDATEEAPKKKIVRRGPPKPPYNFKSVVMPGTIYRKTYSQDNRHLPTARYESDMQRGVVASAARSDINSMRALKKIGTPLNVMAEDGEPVLTVASRLGDRNTVHWLLVQGVDSGVLSPEGLAALHYAAYRGNPEMVEILLSYGADVNQPDMHGVTPLMYAARIGAVDAARKLLEFGANPLMRSSDGKTALDMASMSGNPQMVPVIQDAMAHAAQAAANAAMVGDLAAN